MKPADIGAGSGVVELTGISGSCILWPPRQDVSRSWHGGCFDFPVWGRSMSFRPFTSESYCEGDRLEAWRDVLAAVGLQPSPGSQAVSPLAHPACDMPIMLLPTEDGVTLRTATGHQIISIGHLLLLPRRGDWSVSFQRDMRTIVLSVTSDAFHGRKVSKPVFEEVR